MQIKDLKPADYNPRKITNEKLKMLERSMREFGDLSGIVYNRRTGNLIGGHQRIKHLDLEWEVIKRDSEDDLGTIAEGYIETPFGRWTYREVDWSEEREKAANIAANKHGGEFDFPKLSEILVELDDSDFDMELTGFDENELKAFLVGDGNILGDSESENCQENSLLAKLMIPKEVWFDSRDSISEKIENVCSSYGIISEWPE